MITENVSTLKIHKLTQEQYDRELAAGNIDENALYLTPDDTAETYMTKENPTGTGSFSLNRKGGTTVGDYSYAEGYDTTASGNLSHAEGCSTEASGIGSHAEGYDTTASGNYSHAEGWETEAFGDYSHAEGQHTTASGENQHVQGKYNIKDIDSSGNALNTYAHIVGNGTSETARSNAHTVDWDGNAWYAGNIKVGGTGQDDTAAKTVATTDMVTAVSVSTACNETNSQQDTFGTKCLYYPGMDMCYIRQYHSNAIDFVAGQTYVMGTVDAAYAPGYITPLAVSGKKEFHAYINDSGEIVVQVLENFAAGHGLRIAGFWPRSK